MDFTKIKLEDKVLVKIWETAMETKDPDKTADSQKKKAFLVRKYTRAQNGCEYYLEVAATGKRYPVPSKREGNSWRDYLWDYTKNYVEKSNYKRGHVVSSQKQWYWHQEMPSLIHKFILDLQNGFVPESSKGKKLRPKTIRGTRHTFVAFNTRLIQIYPNIMLKDFFEPHEIKGYLDSILSLYKKDNLKGVTVSLFIKKISYFEYWLEEFAKKKIEEKYLNQFNAKKEEIENNHSLNFSEKQRSLRESSKERDKQISEEKKYLKNNPLISIAAIKEMKRVREQIKDTREKRKKPKYKDPLDLIKEIENNLDKITTTEHLRTAFGVIVNLILMFRANEFLALKFSDFEVDEEGNYKVEDYIRVITKDVNGKKIVENTNKTNTKLNRCLDSEYVKYIEYLKHPIFSHHKAKYIMNMCVSGDYYFIQRRDGRKAYFKSKGRSLFQFLKDEGFGYLSKKIFPKNLKRDFIIEATRRGGSINMSSSNFRDSIKSIMKQLGLPYTAPHRTFRSSGVTSYILENGLTLETIQYVMDAMGWSSEAMVMNYINDVLTHENKKRTSLAMASSKKSKSKVKNILKGLSAEELKELQDAMDKMK